MVRILGLYSNKEECHSGIFFHSSNFIQLRCFSYFDWATCPTTRKFITGFSIFLGNSFITWKSKAADHFKKFLRSRVQSHDCYYMWNPMVNISSPRFSGSLCPACHPLLRQSTCYSNSQQSCLSRTHQTYWNWLVHHSWKGCNWASQTSSHFFLHASCWHFHQIPTSQHFHLNTFQVGNEEHLLPAWREHSSLLEQRPSILTMTPPYY